MTQVQTERLDPDTSTLVLALDTDLYSRDVLYSASYVFIDRAYVLLDRVGDRYVVQFRSKQPVDEATLTGMAGEFENELLAQALRERVGRVNQKIIEDVTALAIGGATTATTPDAPAGMSGEDGYVDDPKGLGAPWEAKKETGG